MSLVITVERDVDSLLDQRTDGEFSSFRDFYQDNHDRIRKVLFRFGVVGDLDDVVQNTFVKAWANLAKFKKQSNIKTWLVKIAINEAHNYFYKTAKYQQVGLNELPENFEHSKFEDREAVSIALQTLSLNHRMVLVLNVIEGHTLDEISVLMKVPVGTTKSRLNRAKEKMQQALEKLGVCL
ncbi:MAG: RNA polymerase sigma factor [Bdellovibrionota bacterium]